MRPHTEVAITNVFASNAPIPRWLLGTPFLRAVYTVYDVPTANVYLAVAQWRR